MSKKVKNILVLGDSYIFGHGCQDRVHYVDDQGVEHGDTQSLADEPSEFAWASLLAKRFPDKVNVYNLSLSGVDNQSLVSALCNFLDNGPTVDLIMFNTSPGTRMLVNNVTRHSYKDTPFLKRLIQLDDTTKSANWQVFRESRPRGIQVMDDDLDEYTKFIGLYYHDALGVQTAMSAVLSAHSISQMIGAKFIWMSPSYCSATMNMPLFPAKVRSTLAMHQCIHIADFQRRDRKKYQADDGHSNEQCHEDYFNEVVKAKIASLGMF
jgi:hypothetical protein